MTVLLLWIARAAGLAGALLTVVAGVARVGGVYQIGSFQVVTLLQAGTAGMVLGCLAYLTVLAERGVPAC